MQSESHFRLSRRATDVALLESAGLNEQPIDTWFLLRDQLDGVPVMRW